MKRILHALTFLFLSLSVLAQKTPAFEVGSNAQNFDWIINSTKNKAKIYTRNNNKELVLDNGLVKRGFRISPNVACIDYENQTTHRQLLRAVMPEAVITINHKTYNVGGLYGQKEKAYLLPEWIDDFTKNERDFQFVDYIISEIPPYLNAKTRFWATHTQQASGKLLRFRYQSNLSELKDINVMVQYAIYDGLPLIKKRITIENKSKKTKRINQMIT